MVNRPGTDAVQLPALPSALSKVMVGAVFNNVQCALHIQSFQNIYRVFIKNYVFSLKELPQNEMTPLFYFIF